LNTLKEKNEEILKQIKYDEKGLVPAVIQDYETGRVLMLGYMNEESLRLTLTTGRTWFFSRSRQKLWNKGETSGHFQNVKKISYDCDCDTILVIAEQIGAACHTGNFSCFYRDFEYEEPENRETEKQS
jgi:phosphoribosyl-AMP cyclohydrolase